MVDPTPISLKERASFVYLERGNIGVENGCLCFNNSETHNGKIPIGAITCLMIGPGTQISHAAIALASRVGCLITWVGESGVKLYSAGVSNRYLSDHLLTQAKFALDEKLRSQVVRNMYSFRYKEKISLDYTIDQMRGVEGIKVKDIYAELSKKYNIEWNGRCNHITWKDNDIINRCISSANACLYGICETAILAAGYSTAIGFVHTGQQKSFVYDIADLFKFDTVVPIAFQVASQRSDNYEKDVRNVCKECFRNTDLLKIVIPTIDGCFQ